MTLDVTIGKIVENKRNKKCHKFNVEMCPKANRNICNPEHTIYPAEAYRSGPHGFWLFWEQYCPELYTEFREHLRTNDRDVSPLRPYLDKINTLSDKCNDKTSEDRIVWFKYWANKAVELYGDAAGIKFN